MDYKQYARGYTGMVLGGALVANIMAVDAGVLNGTLTPFQCAVDVCNIYGKPQFCDVDRCLNCEDVENKCATGQMPVNCSNYCWELKTKETIDRTCPPPWNISNGYVKAPSTSYGRYLPGTNLTFVCDRGYELIGMSTFSCNEQGRWIPDTASPFCAPLSTSSELEWVITAGIMFGFVGILLSVIVVLITRKPTCIYQKLQKKRNLVKTKLPSENRSTESVEANEEETPLVPGISTENVPKTDNEPQPKIANGNGPHYQYPIQEQTVDETKYKGTSPLSPRDDRDNLGCEELNEPGNKRKIALGPNTYRNSDITPNTDRSAS